MNCCLVHDIAGISPRIFAVLSPVCPNLHKKVLLQTVTAQHPCTHVLHMQVMTSLNTIILTISSVGM